MSENRQTTDSSSSASQGDRGRRNLNDPNYTSLFVNLIRAALPFARPFQQAWDIVRAEQATSSQAGTAGESRDDESELDETDFMTETLSFSPADDPENPKAQGPTWYSVVRGTRVGVFKDLEKVVKATHKIPYNSHKGFPTHALALKHWLEQHEKGETRLIIKETEKEQDMSTQVPALIVKGSRPMQVEITNPVVVQHGGGAPWQANTHARAASSVHDSDIPDFSPDIRDDFSLAPSDPESLDFIAALQQHEGVNAQAQAYENDLEAEEMIEAALEHDHAEQMLAANAKGKMKETVDEDTAGASTSGGSK